MKMNDYWKECIAEAFEDAGIVATDKQIGTVAYWIEGAHQTIDMAFGHDCIPNPAEEENKRLRQVLIKEQEKVICKVCSGAGGIVDLGPCHSSHSTCWKCKGEGRHAP